ncbi:hypothetical protein AX16_006976 [Volvariella volvacea WC 439]|nr:hypothetical protein AX16_006976 [Volvariella volvacea WC 439]
MSKWTSKELEKIVQEKLECNLQQENTIPELLEASIRELDDRLTRPLKELFPEGQLTRISKDTSPASKKGKEAHRATKMYSCGSTVLVALTDPEQRNLWVASLGDCQAMLGYKVSGEWAVRTLSGYHNTSNPDEESRIRMEHPNEPQCVADGRVLGRLLVTRAVGDLAFKLPAEYSQVLGSTKQEEVRDLIAWSRTPPYISNVAEVQHVSLESEFQRGCKMYLIMCSDGLVDLYERRGVERGEMGRVWIDILRKKIGSSFTKEEKNKALRLLKYGHLAVIKDTIAKTERQDQPSFGEHYRSDHHRYNMKRRVAGLPPVSAAIFNQKVLERRQETAVMSSARGASCDVCGKTYTTENAYRSHLSSKKHKENELKGVKGPRLARAPPEEAESSVQTSDGGAAAPSSTTEQPTDKPVAPSLDGQTGSLSTSESSPESTSTSAAPAQATEISEEKTKVKFAVAEDKDKDEESDEEAQSFEAKIAAARSRLSPNHCLFCTVESSSLPENLTHMSSAHSFFIPDAEFLVDLPGLIAYLGEKIAVGNVCIFCNGKGREFRTLEAVRKHMLDKSHCKIAYDTGDDKLEISDYYDFTSSYPDAQLRKEKKEERRRQKEEKEKKLEKKAAKAEEEADEVVEDEEGEWEDDEDVNENEVDEVVDVLPSSDEDSDLTSEDESDDDSIPDNQLTYGDSHYELVLPSGARIGHRSMRRYYAQNFSYAPKNGKSEDPNSGAALVRKLVTDKNSALVPRKGGFGAYGAGTDVVKARNRGEAKEAGRHVQEYRDVRRRQEFMTKVGYVHNHQKHYRDPLLQ